MPSPNRIAPGLSNMKETVRASSTVASDNRRYAQQAKGQSCITPVGYQAAGVPWSSRSDHASNWGTACWPFQRTVSFYTAFHVFSVYDSRVQAHEFSTCRGATFMHEMAVSLPERLPNEIAGVLTPGIRIISTGVDIRRMATLQGMLNTLQGRLKERTAQLEAQVAEGQKVEERLRELTTRVLHAQDDESRRIARELHDSAGQYLAAIQMNLNALERDTSSPLSSSQIKRVTDSVEMVDHCSAEIRTLSYLLHPPLLDEMGLASALSMYSDGFAERSGIRGRTGHIEGLWTVIDRYRNGDVSDCATKPCEHLSSFRQSSGENHNSPRRGRCHDEYFRRRTRHGSSGAEGMRFGNAPRGSWCCWNARAN